MGNNVEVKKKFTGLLLTGTCLFLIGFWFESSTIHYKASKTIFPFRTAGWFVIGFIFTASISCGISMLFCLIAKKLPKLAWFLMFIVSALFIFYAVNSSLPQKQLVRIIGKEATEKMKLEELYIGDSFNDGMFAYGVLSGNEKSMAMIKKHRHIEYKISIPLQGYDMFRYFKERRFPETGNIYSDDHGSFYIPPGENKIYFSWHSRVFRSNSMQN